MRRRRFLFDAKRKAYVGATAGTSVLFGHQEAVASCLGIDSEKKSCSIKFTVALSTLDS